LTNAGAAAYESREGDAVECNYLFHFVDVSIEKRHDGADTSVVDSIVILEFPSACFHFREIYLLLRSATIGVMWRPLALARLLQ